MAARSKQAMKAATAAGPWVQRLAEDEELRDNLRVAFEAAKEAYERISDGKSPRELIDDKKLQKELKQVAEALKDAGSALKEGPTRKPKRKKGGIGRKLLVLVVGAAIALALSEDLRNKVLDLLFGKEEEFDYGSAGASSTSDGGGS